MGFLLLILIDPLWAARSGFPVLASYANADFGTEAAGGAMAQDTDGVLYLGASGLLSFDGDRWTRTPLPNTYQLLSIRFGSDGRLWASGTNELGWFARDDSGNWSFHSLRQHLPAEHEDTGEVWCVFPHKGGAIFAAENVLLRWDGTRFTGWPMRAGRRLFASSDGRDVFVDLDSKGLYRVAERGPEIFLPQTLLGKARGQWLERERDGWLLGTSEGFFRTDGRTLEPFAPEVAKFIQRHRLTDVTRLPDRRIAIGTLTGGVAILQPDGRLDHFLGEKEGLPSLYVRFFFVDREGNLWIGTFTHIVRSRLNATPSLFDVRSGLPARPIIRIAQWRDRIVVANDTEVYQLADDRQTFSAVESLRGSWNQLTGGERGVLAGGFKGAKFWDGTNAVTAYQTERDLYAFTVSPDRSMLRFVSDDRKVIPFDLAEPSRIAVKDLPYRATSIAEDKEGQLWLGTFGGGIMIMPTDKPGTWSSVRQGLPELLGRTHVRTSGEGTVVVFAENGGWHKARGSDEFVRIRHYPERKAVVSEMGPDGTLWLVHAADDQSATTLARVSLRDRDAIWEPWPLAELWSIGVPRVIHVETTADTRNPVVWIGGNRGLLRYPLNGFSPEAITPAPPLIRVFARKSDTERAVVTTSTTTPFSDRAIELEFAAPEFTWRDTFRIETRVDGIDADWSTLGSGSRRELAGLREGNYAVLARVVAATGTRSAPTRFEFEVLPPWWRTASAYLGYAVAFSCFGFAAYRLRIRALRRQTAALEEKVRVRTKELEEANAAKTEFVANMSHDIRNPLNGIVGLALALEDTRLDPRQREIVATLRECTTYLSSLVDDVLDFASIEAGRIEIRPGPYVPLELLRSVITTLKAETAERGATLTFEVDSDLPAHVLGDAGRIQQILVNFVSNALKYAGGTIHLSVTRPASAPGELEFAVTDCGPGISADEQERLFTKFTRLKRNSEDSIPGAGLGLAACRLLADIMGGSVGVASTLGHGAKFYLRLPLTVAAPAAERPSFQLPNTTVLLVEDADYNAWAATAVLSRLGLSCDRARTGEEAVRMFRERRYNVVLLDRNLPDIDGTEVARRIRELESDEHHAVLLAVTAYCTAEDRARCLEAGMDAFVGKPLTPEKLRRVLLEAGRKLLAAATIEVPREPARAGVDLSLLSYLSDGTTESLSQQVRRFLDTLTTTERHVATALQNGDYHAVGSQAHRVLGQARMVGSGTLADAARNLEEAAGSRDDEACQKWLRRMTLEIEAVTAAVSRRPQPMSTA